MKKINFFGYYGYKNTGDDSFIEVSSWGAINYWNFEELIFTVNNTPIIQTSNITFNKIPNIKGLNILYKRFSILKSENIVFAGGSLFSNDILITDEISFFNLKNKLFKNKQFGAIGVSIGPFKSSVIEKKYIEIFKKFNFLTLRDKKSFDIACSYNLPFKPILTFDLAALLPKIYGHKFIKTNNALGISVCNYESYIKDGNIKSENERNLYVLNLISRVCQNFDTSLKINFYIFNGNDINGDYKLTNFYIFELNKIGFYNINIFNYNNNVKAVWDSIRYSDVFLTTRLHASIFAYLQNIPFFLLEYHRKCTDFLDTIHYPNEQRIYKSIDCLEIDINNISNVLANKNNYILPDNPIIYEDLSLMNFTQIPF